VFRDREHAGDWRDAPKPRKIAISTGEPVQQVTEQKPAA
jgi:hypothetical protein